MKQRSVAGRLRLPLGALLLATLMASGCGPRFGSIVGTVTYQGKPIKWGNVKVVWEGPPGLMNAASAVLNQDGSYEVGRIPAGDIAQICLHVPMIPIGGTLGGAKPDPEVMRKLREKLGYVVLPDKYTHPDTSGWSLEVKQGVNVFNIDVPAEGVGEKTSKPAPAPKTGEDAKQPAGKSSS
jgi:hypothetical protein